MLTPCLEPPAVILVLHPDRVEEDLALGEIVCPRCDVPLHGWSWARRRHIRQLDGSTRLVRPRRARCRSCRGTHVLLPADCLPRRADSAQVVGAAVLARADGCGYRRIAARLGRAASTVRGWCRPLQKRHLAWLYRRGVEHIHRYDRELLGNRPLHGTDLANALEYLGTAVIAFRRRLADSNASMWSLITMFTSGRLLGPTPET